MKTQTLPMEQWELLIIDNASDQLLCEKIDLSWHLNSRHLRENKLGLTPARLRGIQESQADILVFVDDDNVLDHDYLKISLQIGKDWSILGAWGGQAKAKFDELPPDWTRPFWGYLAIREFDQDKWSNLVNQFETVPFGAGLCVRKVVAERYADLINNDPKRANLDRKGKLLLSGGDVDLALTACDIGLGTGLFVSLQLTHLMPSRRLQEEYLLKVVEGTAYSNIILDFIRGKPITPRSWRSILTQYLHPRRWRMEARLRRFSDAYQRGCDLAVKVIVEQSSQN